MPIRQLLDHAVFNPEEIAMLRDVFEDTLRALNLADRSDPVTMLVAKKLIELASQGERDAGRLREAALRAFVGVPGAQGTRPVAPPDGSDLLPT